MIIIEGPDGMGKTTLGQQLQGALAGAALYRIGGSPGSLQDTHAYCARCISRAGTWCIQDRVTMISEQIYSSVFERPSLSASEFDFWQRKLLTTVPRPTIVYARVEDLDQVTPRVEEYETQEYVDRVVERLGLIRDKYDSLFRRLARVKPKHTRILTYDFTRNSFDELHQHILEGLRRS